MAQNTSKCNHLTPLRFKGLTNELQSGKQKSRAYSVVVSADNWFIELSRLVVLVSLHVEYVRHVQFPRLVVAAVIHRMTEQLLQLMIVRSVPQDRGLLHQHRDVPGDISCTEQWRF